MIQRFQDFVSGITVCYKYVQRIKNMAMTQFGLKGIHVSCIFHLRQNPRGLTAAQLCRLCAEDKATISRVIAELREQGYVTQQAVRNYRAPLYLTEAGKAIAEKMDPLITAWVSVGGDGMTGEEREIFYRCLARIADNLGTRLECANEF